MQQRKKLKTLFYIPSNICMFVGLIMIFTTNAVFADANNTKMWTGPIQVSSDNTWTSPNEQLAVNEHGDGIAVWQQYTLDDNSYGIWVARFKKDTGWEEPIKVSHNTLGQVGNPTGVAINEQGDAVVVWPVFNFTSSPLSTVWSSYYDHENGWSQPVKIQDDDTDAYSPMVAMDERGNAVAIWNQNNPEYDRTNIYASYYRKGSGWTHSTMIQSDSSVLSVGVDLVNDGDGNAVAMWSQYDSNPDNPQTGLVTSSYVERKGWQAPVFVTHDDTYSPSIAINEDGKSIAAWAIINPLTHQYNVRASLRQGNEPWGESQSIQSNPYVDANSIDAALTEHGDALVIWRGREYVYFGPASVNIYSNTYNTDSGWAMDQMIDEAAPYSEPQLAMDEHGNAIALWEKTTAGPNPYVNFHDVYAYHYSPAYGWDSSQVIEEYDGDSTYPRVAMSENGDALAVWEQSDNLGGPTLWSNQFTSP